MDLELFEETCPKKARVSSKFRPKAKPPQLKKNSQTPISSGLVMDGSDHLPSNKNVNVHSRVALDSVVDSFGNENCHSGFEDRVVEGADIVTDRESLDESICDPSTVLGNPVPSPGLLNDHVSSSGDLELFQDIDGEPFKKNVRVGSKFKPKAKPLQVKKNLQKPTSSGVVDAESSHLPSIENEGSSVALDSVYGSFSNDQQHSGFENRVLGNADMSIGLGSQNDSAPDEATILGNPAPSESPNDHISGSKDVGHRLANLVYPDVDDDLVGISDTHIRNLDVADHITHEQDEALVGSVSIRKQRKPIDDHQLFVEFEDEVLEDRNVPAEQKDNLQNDSMKPTLKRKKDTESSDQAGKKPRKKFSHTTWRRRQKAETSDDDTSCQKRPLSKGKAKTPKYAWSNPDTELFYQAFSPLKTDFAMIQQSFFPSKTRKQIKAKYKKENHRHPIRIHEAETSRVKDEPMLLLLKQIASELKQNTSRADLYSMSVEHEMEEEQTPEAADAHVGEADKFGRMEDSIMSENTKADDIPETQSITETSDDEFLYQYKSVLRFILDSQSYVIFFTMELIKLSFTMDGYVFRCI